MAFWDASKVQMKTIDVVFSGPSEETNALNCRCGPLIDLCRGPHVRHTGKIKALKIHKVSPQCPLCSCAVRFEAPSWDEKRSCVSVRVPNVLAVNIFVPLSRAEALVVSVSRGVGCTQRNDEN